MKLKPTHEKAARDYCATIAEACRRLKIDPIEALTEADDYPALARQWQVEFSIGWLHGVADLAGIKLEALWAAYAPKARALTPNRRTRLAA